MSRQRNPIFQRHRCPRFSDLNFFPARLSSQNKPRGSDRVMFCSASRVNRGPCEMNRSGMLHPESGYTDQGDGFTTSTRLTLQRSTPSFSSTAVPARFTLIQSTKYTLKKGLKDPSPGTSGQSRNEIHHKPTMHVYTQYPGSQATAKSNI